MEQRINKKTQDFMATYKEYIKNQVLSGTNEIIVHMNENDKINAHKIMVNVIQHVYDYENLAFKQEDFDKRKRIKNHIPICDRCCGKRASGEQCTRRKKNGHQFCGTHVKGTPHGTIGEGTTNDTKTTRVVVWTQDIKGIVHYIDDQGNVYDTEDIMKNAAKPRIIAKYLVSLKNGENVYSIEE